MIDVERIPRRNDGVPILSKDSVDDLGEALVADFFPEGLVHPQPIDIDSFAKFYIGLNVDYQLKLRTRKTSRMP